MPQLASSAFLITCSGCQHEFLVPRRAQGKKVACPHCRKVLLADPQQQASVDPLVGKSVGGVLLERRLGAGALGVVYEGRQQSLARRVAIKMLSSKAAKIPVQVKRFQREAKIAAQIQHPNVVAVIDHGFDRGLHYLVMEYVEGGTLAQRIDEMGRMPWREAMDVLIQIARALELLARHEIIHRDVKPANILISTEGVAKLADLGLAKQEDNLGDGSMLTMQGTMMGSPAYCAPEQARDASSAGHAADLYSLGATLFHAVTGQPPFQGKSAIEVIRKVLTQAPPEARSLVPDLPEGINDFIAQLMDKDPAARPQQPSEFLSEISQVLEAPSKRVQRRRVSPQRSRSKQRQPLWLWLLVALVILLFAAVLFLLFQ